HRERLRRGHGAPHRAEGGRGRAHAPDVRRRRGDDPQRPHAALLPRLVRTRQARRRGQPADRAVAQELHLLGGDGAGAAPVGEMKPLRWLDERILWLRDQLTPGQRWTAALALTLVILIFGFGLPDRVVVRPSPAAATPPASAPSTGAAGATSNAPSPASPVLSLATTPAASPETPSADLVPT